MPKLTNTASTADISTLVLPPGLIHEVEGGVSTRGEWAESQWTLDTGPPSMTKVGRLVMHAWYTCGKFGSS